MTLDGKARPIATLERAYRVAAKIADASDQDMQVSATGEPERPYVAEPVSAGTRKVVARIVAGAPSEPSPNHSHKPMKGQSDG